ncbi:MAG: high-potential iron-sulfur protein [Wenzhouxiangellaceae bacterium]
MKHCSRRDVFKLLGTGSLALLLPVTTRLGSAFAQEKLDPENPQAKALGYVHDSATVDSGKWPTHSAEQRCANCQLAQSRDGEWIPCAIFPGKLVNSNGWCSAWVKAQG